MTNQPESARILLVDFDDPRRETRVRLLESRGYAVTLRKDYIESEKLDHEGKFDMMILALHQQDLKRAAEYTDQVQRAKPELPILLLTDVGVYAPRGTLSKSVETDGYAALLKTVAEMFASSSHIREFDGAESLANDASSCAY
jgi:ActR/RegA family two-component response regulator